MRMRRGEGGNLKVVADSGVGVSLGKPLVVAVVVVVVVVCVMITMRMVVAGGIFGVGGPPRLRRALGAVPLISAIATGTGSSGGSRTILDCRLFGTSLIYSCSSCPADIVADIVAVVVSHGRNHGKVLGSRGVLLFPDPSRSRRRI